MELFKLLGIIAIDNDNANKEIDETKDKAEKSGSKITAAFKKIGAAVATYFAADKIKDFGLGCIQAAADAQAMESQFTQVFGEMETQASEKLAAIADTAGIVENRLKGSFTQIAAFAKTTGMGAVESLALTERAMIAATDSAAFYDRTLEETTNTLQSFLKGNYENDAALGLSATEFTRNEAAMELYGKKFTELSETQKEWTLLHMVEEANELSGALGQASRESETWTNQVGNLKQAWTDFMAMVGEKVLPVAVKIVEKLQEVVTWMTENEEIVTVLAVSIGTLAAALVAFNVVQGIKTAMNVAEANSLWALVAAQTAALAPYLAIAAVVAGLIGLGVLLVENWDKIVAKAKEMGQKLKSFFEGIAEGFLDIWEGIKEGFKSGINWILEGVETWINGWIQSINKLIDGLNYVVEGFGNLIGVEMSVPNIKEVALPRLARGGILERGQVGLLEGSGAEAVVPLDQNRAWISAVAEDMNSSIGGSKDVQELKDMFAAFVNDLPDMMIDAFAAMRFDMNNREFARLVKAVN